MKIFGLALLFVLPSFQAAFATSIIAAYKCTVTSAKPTDPDWKSMAFPLIHDTDGWEVSPDSGSSSLFELTPIDPSKIADWPKYKNGTYYAANNNIYVLIIQDKTVQVVQPFETDLNTQQRPSTYNCIQTM